MTLHNMTIDIKWCNMKSMRAYSGLKTFANCYSVVYVML